ncbi:MAG: hypothetical protein Q7U26_17515 [Aquabacterium sp.]|nr:hypothetical protein [Aquabacterium sp.]
MRSLSFRRRHLQRIVWLTLVGWLFALASGVVNACLTAPSAVQRSGAAQATMAGGAAHRANVRAGDHHASEGQTVAALQLPHERSAAAQSCQKFCDDEASALSKGVSSSVDLPASSVVAFFHWPLDVPGSSAAVHWLRWQTTAQGPPLVIRLLRLTL